MSSFVFYSVNMVYYIDFSYVEPVLVMKYNPFYIYIQLDVQATVLRGKDFMLECLP